jgi:hypothetical protein
MDGFPFLVINSPMNDKAWFKLVREKGRKEKGLPAPPEAGFNVQASLKIGGRPEMSGIRE